MAIRSVVRVVAACRSWYPSLRALSTDVLSQFPGSGTPSAEEELRWEYHHEIAHAIQSGSLTDAATAYMDMYEEGVLPLSNTYETLLMAADYQPNRTPGPRGGPNAQRSSADDPMDVLSLEFMLRVLNDMRRAGCRPGVELYNKLLFVCGQRRQPELSASLLHDLRGLNDGAPDVETLCAVIRVLGRSGRLDEAFAIVFGEEWHAGFASRERVGKAAKLPPTTLLRVKRFKPSRIALAPLFVDSKWKGSTNAELLSLSDFGSQLGRSSSQDERMYTALINACASDASDRSIALAIEVWYRMQRSFEALDGWHKCPSIMSYNSVMGVLSRSGAMRTAFQVLSEMEGFSALAKSAATDAADGGESGAEPAPGAGDAANHPAHIDSPTRGDGVSDSPTLDAAEAAAAAAAAETPERFVRCRPNASTFTLMVKGAAQFVYENARPPPSAQAQEELKAEREHVKRRAVAMAEDMYEMGFTGHRRLHITVARMAKEIGDERAEKLALANAEKTHDRF